MLSVLSRVSGLGDFVKLILALNDSELKTLENIVGKGENAGNQHFLLFPQCFLPIPKRISVLKSHFFLSSAKHFQFGPVYYFVVW